MAVTSTTLLYASIASAVIGAGTTVYAQNEQRKDASAAAKFNEQQAEFNAEQQRNAATTAANDSRQNALRTQEQHRKYLAGLRARFMEKSGAGTIEGGDRDFLNESVGNLQLQILDQGAASQRQQAGYYNNAFAYDNQAAGFGAAADRAQTAGTLATGAAVLNGFGSVYGAGYQQGVWGMGTPPKATVIN